jgi:DNA-binding transcriptional LysR family regulator
MRLTAPKVKDTIAQPSLSQQIRRLEVQLGVTLFERSTRSVRLTPAGTALLREGKRLLRQAEHAIASVRDAGAPRLTVGFYGSAASELLPAVLSSFEKRLPAVKVSLRELLLGSVDEILDGTVDLAFTRLLPGQTQLEVEVIAHEPRVATLASTHPLADSEALALADLKDESFIVNPAVRSDGPPPRWLGEQRRHGLPGRVAASSTSLQEVLTLVASGRGVCLLPAAVARYHARSGVDPAWQPLGRR